MNNRIAALVGVVVLTAATGALASTASQREYKLGYADCLAGRWDENQHGASYKDGCRAAEAKRNAAGEGAAPAAEAAPEAATPKPARTPAKVSDGVPAKDKKACLAAVKKTTHNPKVVVIDASASEANNTVNLGVGPDKAPWRCLVKRGKVAEVTSMTDEGAL